MHMTHTRDFRLASKTGVIIQFVAGEKVWVPPHAVHEAMGVGAQPALEEGESLPPVVGNIARKIVFVGPLRDSLIFGAIEKIVAENDTAKFDGAGIPKVKAVSDMLGFDVQKSELGAMHRRFREVRANNEKWQYHPTTEAVFDTLAATTLPDLEMVAKVNGLAQDSFPAMTFAEARKTVLLQLTETA